MAHNFEAPLSTDAGFINPHLLMGGASASPGLPATSEAECSAQADDQRMSDSTQIPLDQVSFDLTIQLSHEAVLSDGNRIGTPYDDGTSVLPYYAQPIQQSKSDIFALDLMAANSTASDQPFNNSLFPTNLSLSTDAQWFLENHASTPNLIQGDFSYPPGAVDMADLPLNLGTGLPTGNSVAVTPNFSAPFFSATNQPFNMPVLPQATGHPGYGIDPDGPTICGMLAAQTKPLIPGQPRCIRPKPPATTLSSDGSMPTATSKISTSMAAPLQPAFQAVASHGDSATRKRKHSISPRTKRAGIPDERTDCFQIHKGPSYQRDDSSSAPKRTRSGKVCLRCQDQHLKCEGVFPCRNCQQYSRRDRRVMELPCFDADIRQLNHFNVFVKFYELAIPEEVPDILDNLNRKQILLLEIQDMLIHNAMKSITKLGWRSLYFIYFASTGVPISEARAIFKFRILKPLSITLCKSPDRLSPDFSAISFFLTITQRRNLAKLAHLSERDVEAYVSLMSSLYFDKIAVLLAKVRRGQALPAEKESLGVALVVLLFASQVRSTYVFQAAERILDQLSSSSDKQSESMLRTIEFMLFYTVTLSDKQKYLRIWAQHWLRKLYGGNTLCELVEFASLVLTALNCTELDPDARLEDADLQIDDDEIEAEDVELAPPPIGRISHEMAKMAEALGYVTDLQGKLDNPAYNDLSSLFSSRLSFEATYILTANSFLAKHGKGVTESSIIEMLNEEMARFNELVELVFSLVETLD